ncbi:MAG TPA: hypothetical protein PKA27_12775 [Fimbriimonadaceae bacterium]|nr:hypothetical protein [Fimbriimonadaceae bacterium]
MRYSKMILSALASLAAFSAISAPFTPGNLVVIRVGDGSAAPTTAGTALFLDEFTTGGSTIQSLAMPTSTSGANRAFTHNGTSTAALGLTRSLNNQYLFLGGYDATPGTVVNNTDSTVINRVVARVDANCNIDTTTALTDAYSTNTAGIRSVYSVDGTGFWLAGNGNATTSGIRYATLGASTSTSVVQTPNTRVVSVWNGQLYASTMTGAFRGVNTVGTGLPTGTGEVFTLLNGFSSDTGSPQDVYDFYFADAATLYVADNRTAATGGGIQKWVDVAGTWTYQYSLNDGTQGIRRFAAVTAAGITTFYATTATTNTTAPNQLLVVSDLGPGSTATVLATSPTNTIFRGVAWTPEAGSSVINPSGYTVLDGEEFEGDLNSLVSSDDNKLCVFNDPTTLNAGVQFDGSTTVTNPGTFKFRFEYNVARPGLAYAASLYRWTTGAYVFAGGNTATTSDTSVEIVLSSNRSDYVGNAGALRSKVAFGPINDEDPSQDGWLHCFDVVEWELAP